MIIVPLSLIAWNAHLSGPAPFVVPFVVVDPCCIFTMAYEEKKKKNSSCWSEPVPRVSSVCLLKVCAVFALCDVLKSQRKPSRSARKDVEILPTPTWDGRQSLSSNIRNCWLQLENTLCFRFMHASLFLLELACLRFFFAKEAM